MSQSIRTSQQIRQAFLDFFASKGHLIVPSSPVVPHDDPTLMFTNAGMNQFKGVFLGDNPKGLSRATSSQKCIRAGDKHNDLENVGQTARHLTFFEMLGNFSFGDYFKRDAILYAWEFLTSKDWLAIPAHKLMATVYASDDEAFGIWRDEVGLPEERIVRIGDNKGAPYASDNFWQMGDTGPCGPCSEIFYDHGDHIFGGPPGSPDEDGDRFIEIWNNVFMQFNRDESGVLHPLPKQSVDTGMGLERITAVLQGSNSNYDTDIFKTLLAEIANLSGVPYASGPEGMAHRVISDHVRTISFAIADGVLPSNEGRGYVIRRILRRASRFARNLGQKEAFLIRLIPTLVNLMGEAYPELAQRQNFILQVVKSEEERFLKTLDTGLILFDKLVADLRQAGASEIPGDKVFQLYDTFGFPADLTRMIAAEQGLTTDEAGFEAAMTEQKDRARAARKEGISLADESAWTVLQASNGTQFTGYENESGPLTVSKFRVDDAFVYVVAAQTPFYAEAGGQVGDVGTLTSDFVTLEVLDTVKLNDTVLHKCQVVNGEATAESMGAEFLAQVRTSNRDKTRKNHSATHLLHAALRQVLGEHVVQQGSRVSPEGLRFDFSHPSSLTQAQIRQVEDLVNAEILSNHPVQTMVQDIESAKAAGAMALFGEKYEDDVRVVSMGDFSMELCGGLHVNRTGDIGSFRLLSEAGTAAGVRRIEAVTGPGAIARARQDADVLTDLQNIFKCKPEDLVSRIAAMQEHQKKLEKTIEHLNDLAARSWCTELTQNADQIVVHSFEALDKPLFGKIVENMAANFAGVTVLANVEKENATIAVTVAKALHSKTKAGELVGKIAALAGGKGGGRPDKAQAGTKEVTLVPVAMSAALGIVTEALS